MSLVMRSRSLTSPAGRGVMRVERRVIFPSSAVTGAAMVVGDGVVLMVVSSLVLSVLGDSEEGSGEEVVKGVEKAITGSEGLCPWRVSGRRRLAQRASGTYTL